MSEGNAGAVGGRAPAPVGTDTRPGTAPARPEEPPMLAARGIVKDYSDGESAIRVLAGVDLEVARGEALAITGRSGAGKSTLLHILGLVDSPTEGEVLLRGEVVSAPGTGCTAGLFGRLLRRPRPGRAGPAQRGWRHARARIRNRAFGFVFQAYHLIEELTALENVLLPAMMVGPVAWARVRAAARERAERLLEEVGLADRMKARPSRLSGGERQRVAIARALVNEPQVLFCDEPTGNLDESTSASVHALLRRLQKERGLTQVVVTHDRELASQADRVVRIEGGRIVEAASG